MFGGALVAREAVPLVKWAGAGLAFAGLLVLVGPTGNVGAGSAGAFGPVALMVLAGLGWGIYSLAGRGAVDPLLATAANFGIALPIAGVFGLVVGFGQTATLYDRL